MAASTNFPQLRAALENESLPLAKRLTLARNAFFWKGDVTDFLQGSADVKTSELSHLIFGKEQIVLNWLCGHISSNRSGSVLVWKTLLDCLTNGPIRNLLQKHSIRLGGQFVAAVVDGNRDEVQEELIRSVSLASESPELFSLSQQDYEKFTKFVGAVIASSVGSCMADPVCLTLSQAVISFQKQETNQVGLFQSFLCNVAFHLLSALQTWNGDIQGKWRNVTENLIFSDSLQNEWRQLVTHCLSELQSAGVSDTMKSFVSFVHLLAAQSPNLLPELFGILGNGYLRRYKYKEAEGLQLFSVLCGFLGILPEMKDGKHLVSSRPEVRDLLLVPNLSADVRDSCLLRLLEPLQSRGIDFYAAAKEITWLDFLQSITLQLFKNTTEFRPAVDPLARILVEIHPSIVNPVLSRIVRICLAQFVEGRSSTEAANLVEFLLKTSQKLRNVPKFVGYIINAVKKLGGDSSGTVQFPAKFFDDFAACIHSLPMSQSFTIWSTLAQTLQEQLNATDKIENGASGEVPTPSNLLVFKATADLFSALLLDVKLADYTLPREMTLQASGLVEELKTLLHSMTPLVKDGNEVVLETYLRLVFAYGELQQLLLLYSRPYAEEHPRVLDELQRAPSVEPPPSMKPFHEFLDDNIWQQLFDRSSKSPAWFLLTLQKLRSGVLLQNCSRDSLVGCVNFLHQRLEQDGRLFAANFEYIQPYLTPDQLADACYYIADQPDAEWKAVLERSGVMDNPQVHMGVIQAVLRRLQARRGKRKHDSTAPVSTKWRTALKKLAKAPGVWIQCVEKLSEDCGNTAREAAETLVETMKCGQTSSGSITQEEVDPLLEILQKLPLEFLTNSTRLVAQLGLIAVFIGLDARYPESAKERIWMTLVRLMDSQHKITIFFDYIPSSVYVTWAIASVSSAGKPVFSSVLTTFLEETTRSSNGLKNIGDWTKAFIAETDAGPSETVIVAMETFWKVVQTSGGAVKKSLAAKNFHRLRRYFLKNLELYLSSPAVALRGASCVLTAYFDDLQKRRSTQTVASKEADKPMKVRSLLQRLPRLNKLALEGLASADEGLSAVSVAYLEALVSNQKSLKNHAPPFIRLKIFNAYRGNNSQTRWKDRFLERIISSAKDKELRQIVNVIIEDIGSVSQLNLDNVESFRRAVALLGHLLTAEVQPDSRFSVRLHAAQSVLPVLERIVVAEGPRGNMFNAVLEAAEVFRVLLNVDKPYAYPQDVAACLQVCLAVPLSPDQQHADFQSSFTVVYKLLNSLVKRHGEIAADRIPVVLEVFRRLLRCVCIRSDQNRKWSEVELVELSSSAERLARLTSVISNQRLRYRRVASYLVADIVDQFQSRTLYPSVKHSIVNALYNLMDMLDQHAPRYLMAALPAGATELFRTEYDMFHKYHKFTGKV